MSDAVNYNSVGRFRLPAESEKDARTLGNRLRRALLNDTTGIAATAVKIDGAAHEFQAIVGVREDALQLIQHIKRVRMKAPGAPPDGSLRGTIDSASPIVTAGEIKIDGAEVANPDLVVAHLSPGARVRVEIAFERGTGYRAAGDAPEGWIPIEADFCPVKRVSVRPTADALEMEVETDGSVTPDPALAEAMALIGEQRAFESLPPPLGRDLKSRPNGGDVELGPEFHGDPFMGIEPPPALDIQVDSYREFMDQGIPRLLDRLFPLVGRALGNGADQSLPGRTSERGRKIEIISHRLEMPSDTPDGCVRGHKTYEARLILKIRIDRPDGGYSFDYTTTATEEIDMGPIPLMTDDASFIINGAHRCCVMLGDGGYGVLRVGDLLTRELERLIDQMKPFLEDRMDLVGELRGDILNLLPLSATVRELLTSSMWSQYSDETNPLAALTHRTRLSRLPAVTNLPADARDIKMSDFGRLCYLETPEGPNIGLISTLCAYAKLSEAGEIVTPYRKVSKGKAGKEIVYLSATEEATHKIADVIDLGADGTFKDDYVLVREAGDIRRVPAAEVEFVSVSPIQALSRSSALIPFLGHNDPSRSLMASNMQRQAVPLIDPEQPLVKSGVEANAARDSGQLVTARRAGKVIEATGGRIVVAAGGERDVYELAKFRRTNQATCINQAPVVTAGQEVATGDVLADTGATRDGELALGRNVLVAYMPFRGFDFEDAICISDELVREEVFTSIHLEWLEAEVSGSDVWIAPVGTRLAPGDVMVQESSGRKRPIMLAPPPGDSVLVECAPHGGRVKLTFAMKRSMSVGDKFAGRHGNKGCIARILPRSEMPYLDDGTPVQMVLNPLGVVSRINLGQILETHFGALAHALGTQLVIPPFMGPSTKALSEALGKAGLGETGMATLYDGATGRPFDSPVTVGYLYKMKLSHRAEDKMKAYSTAALSAGQIAVQGSWGQRAGFLELWALEAYNAGATLQEFMTVKAEDALGREKTALALLAGDEIDPPSEGGSLELLENALRGVGIKVEEKR